MNLKGLAKRLKALSDQNRLKILYLLSIRPCCVCELTHLIGVSQPTLTKHLQTLEMAGFVESKRFKFYQIYSLNLEDPVNKELLERIINYLRGDREILELTRKLGEKPPYLKEMAQSGG